MIKSAVSYGAFQRRQENEKQRTSPDGEGSTLKNLKRKRESVEKIIFFVIWKKLREGGPNKY